MLVCLACILSHQPFGTLAPRGLLDPKGLPSSPFAPAVHTSPFGQEVLTLSSLQTGEYATDEEDEEGGTSLPSRDLAIEVFELPENEDVFSPSELDTGKLSHKFKEVSCSWALGLWPPFCRQQLSSVL